MTSQLFPEAALPQYLLDIYFQGPSFNGMMEIDSLAKEVQGLETVLRIALHSLIKNKRLNLKSGDLEIYVEAFEKGSFRKRIKVFNRTTKEYVPLVSLATLVVLIFQTIPQYKTEEIKTLSPELIASVRDQVVLELLQDKKFLGAAADIVQPISLGGDMCTLSSAVDNKAVIDSETSKKFINLTDSAESSVDDGEYYEVLQGRINRVDLDASRRHIGFKVNSEGATIDATFQNKPSPEEMKSLLGEWVEIKGNVSYIGGQRSHVDISEFNVIKQRQFDMHSDQSDNPKK
ncbi:hypothetical protein KW800_01655 [Candidatus Parcubacteria bacterium]|nr:hypothetical protein [Candidatus Parcubacteria bacterium]